MPQIDNIPVVIGNTSTQFTALMPSAGDNTPAIWRYDGSENYPPFARPTARVTARDNVKRTARHVDLKVEWPWAVTDTTTGQTSVVAKSLFTGAFVLPTNIPVDIVGNLVEFAMQFAASELIKSSLKSGYAPT